MNNSKLSDNLKALGVGNTDGLKLKQPKFLATFLFGLLTGLGDCYKPERDMMRPGRQPGNNSHPLYNETMAELMVRWKTAEAKAKLQPA